VSASAPLFRLEVAENGLREGVQVTKAADELHKELKKYMPADALPTGEAHDDKGDPVTLLSLGVALVASGAVTEMVKCLRDWLKRRPSSRSVVVRDSDGKEVITVDAENVDDASVVEAIKAAAMMDQG
jgi:hypothetical protein